MSSRSPAEVSFYLGLATALATFSAAGVALGLLHCTRWRDRAASVAVLLSGTLGIGAALATVARGRTSAIANVVIAVSLLVLTTYVLLRALRLIYTVRGASRRPRHAEDRTTSTSSLAMTWTGQFGNEGTSGIPLTGSSAPAPSSSQAADLVLWRPFWATAAGFVAVVALAAVIALPELYSGILRSRPVASGSRIINVVCADGVDNDADGKIDFPADPGCETAADQSEKQGACEDGRDNDADGKTDFPTDPGCTSRADLTESAS